MASIVVFPVLLCIIGLPIWIAIYVYRDATRRGMNAALWTLVALLAPAMVGFIIYLLVRGSYSDLKCPQCAATVRENFAACPQCGTKLRPVCPSCEAPVEVDWKVCPRCARPLPERYDNVTAPNRPKDRSLKRILIAVIAIPLLVIALCVASIVLFINPTIGGGSCSIGDLDLENLYSMHTDNQVREWIEAIPCDSDKAHILCFESKNSDGDMQYNYLIYAPCTGAGGFSGSEIVHGGFSHDVLQLDLYSEAGEEDSVCCVEVSYEKKIELEVYCDGVELECEITEVSFDPSGDFFDPMEQE